MAVHFRRIHRYRTNQQKLADALINSSNCWTGINDYRFKPAREIARNIKKPDGNRTKL
ncbi:hypothetical protein [Lactobacillus sp. ESL0228]|uniref:hypothetical protein n=1 Tax=Lactobacillus sp. ESL0228 TaxID=2069352 RepID=UPI001314F9A5|nr:hypothetical protein [Lactobacillus sp. ESL0228]